MEYIVQIKKYSDDTVTNELGPYIYEKTAEAVDSGVNINLNHEEYYTVIVEKPSENCNCDMRTKLVGDGCAICNPNYDTSTD